MLNMISFLPVHRGADSPPDANIQFVLNMFKIQGCKITHIASSLIYILNVPHPTAVSEQIQKMTNNRAEMVKVFSSITLSKTMQTLGQEGTAFTTDILREMHRY